MPAASIGLFGVSLGGFLFALRQYGERSSKLDHYKKAADAHLKKRLDELYPNVSRERLRRLVDQPDVKLALTDPSPTEARDARIWFGASGVLALLLTVVELLVGGAAWVQWIHLAIMFSLAWGARLLFVDFQFYAKLDKLHGAREEDGARHLGAAEETYPIVQSDSGVRKWTRREIDDLPEPQRASLFDAHPDLRDWWLGKPRQNAESRGHGCS